MKPWILFPCVVVLAKTGLDYKPHPERYETRESTVTVYDKISGQFDSMEVCDDMAEALNEAHKKRLNKERDEVNAYLKKIAVHASQ